MTRTFWLLFEAWISLIAHDRFMGTRGFPLLSQRVRGFPLRAAARPAVRESEIVLAVNLVCSLYPKPVLCLQRSAALVQLLRRHGIRAQMVIGAQKLPFKAHAWVEVDEHIVDDRLASRKSFLVLEVC